jgi:lipoprotein-releasing system ATP-binding protein
MSSPPLLELKGVAKRYASPEAGPEVAVLAEVSLQVRCNETVAIVGPSGSGKSTLLQLIGGLDVPTAGQVLLDGRDLAKLTEDERATIRRKDIGFVFQAHHLLPQCSALENVLLPSLAGPVAGRMTADMADARARDLLNRVGLGSRLTHRPAELSGGERQRVAVARALIGSPRLLLADEPTGSLDGKAAEAMVALLVELNREEDTALIVVTHSAAVSERMSRRLELEGGTLREQPSKRA